MSEDAIASAEPSVAPETAAPEATQEAPAVEATEAPQERATVRESIAKAFDKVGISDEEPAPAKEGERARGPDGKFVAKEQPAEPAEPAEAQPKPAPSSPPARFDAQAKADWKGVPDSVKGAVTRAFSEMEAGLDKHRGALDGFKPFMDAAEAQGQKPADVLNRYMGMEKMLREDPKAAFQTIADNLGVSLAEIMGGEQTDAGRENAALRQEIAQLRDQINGVSNNLTEQRRAEVVSQIDAFAADPKHSRFEELGDDIAFFIQTGKAKSLEEAYGMAERLNPAPQPAPQTGAQPAAQTREPLSINGAPGNGSNPSALRRSKTTSEATRRAFQAVGLA